MCVRRKNTGTFSGTIYLLDFLTVIVGAGPVGLASAASCQLLGAAVVIVGRGPTLGRPLSLLLTLKGPGANAAVTVVHSVVDDLSAHTKRADVVIAAVGSPSIVTADMVKPGAVVVSGGISWEGGSESEGMGS